MLLCLGDQLLIVFFFFFLQGSEKPFVLNVSNVEDKFEILLGMKELASKGMAAEAVEEVNAIDTNFFVQNSVLLFQLKQVCGFYVVIDILFFTFLWEGAIQGLLLGSL